MRSIEDFIRNFRPAWEPLSNLPSDKDLSGKRLLLVARDFDDEHFIYAHENVRKFCNFFKQTPKHREFDMIEIEVFIDGRHKWSVSTYWLTMSVYCRNATTFEEMADGMRQHGRDAIEGKQLQEVKMILQREKEEWEAKA